MTKVFHRIWFDEPVPDKYQENWEKLKKLHPRWGFESWEKSSDLDLVNRELFDSFTEPPAMFGFRSDIARYELLAKYGGVYIDTDVTPLRSFDALPKDRPFIAWCSDKELDPAIIASPKRHPAIELLVRDLDKIREWRESGKPLTPPGGTGPSYVTPRWRWRNDVLRLPPVVWFPYHWTEEPQDVWPRQTLAVHHWDAGWKDAGPGLPAQAPKQQRPRGTPLLAAVDRSQPSARKGLDRRSGAPEVGLRVR